MWEFLTGVLEQAGAVAALFFVTLLGAGAALRALWKANQQALAKVAEIQKEESGKRIEMRKAHEADRAKLLAAHTEELKALRDEHDRELRGIIEARKDDAATYAQRLDALQERRVTETRDVTTKVVQHIASIDTTVGKLGAAIDMLVRVTDQRRKPL